MKSIFEKTTREELIQRIQTLHEGSAGQWGKMNVYQMLKHCTYWDAWVLGKGTFVYKQAFIGKLFGRIGLRRMIKDEKPIDRGVPTSNQFKITEKSGDLAGDKLKWVGLIEAYENYSNPGFIHDFFGKMTKEEIGLLAYKHSDHHLRQFGA